MPGTKVVTRNQPDTVPSLLFGTCGLMGTLTVAGMRPLWTDYGIHPFEFSGITFFVSSLD